MQQDQLQMIRTIDWNTLRISDASTLSWSSYSNYSDSLVSQKSQKQSNGINSSEVAVSVPCQILASGELNMNAAGQMTGDWSIFRV